MRYRASDGKLKYIIDSTMLRIMSAVCKKNAKVGVTQVAQVLPQINYRSRSCMVAQPHAVTGLRYN